MEASNRSSYTEVYFWLAKDNEGYTTTSSEGGRLTPYNERDGLARCGHVSMEIFPQNKPSVYMSFWPGKDMPGVLLNSLAEDQGPYCEGTLPDVIVRLHKLNVEAMLTAFNQVKPRVESGKIKWEYMVSESKDITNPINSIASCVSFVYSFLKIGGLAEKNSIYYGNVKSRGPSDSKFYEITKCSAGDRFWGIFNGAPWTSWIFSPKALLLRVASAAEADPLDKEKTIEIMSSLRVAKEKESGWDGKTIAITTVAVAAIGTGVYMLKK